MNAPNIELRNIKRLEYASQETHCYEASLYVDGQKWGVVGNEGHGGCDWFHPATGRTYADIRALDERIKATMPPIQFEGGSLDPDLELICGELVNAWLRDRDFAKAMKGKVLFTHPDKEGVWQVPVRKTSTFAATLEAMRSKFPHYTYLSDLPVDQAKAIYFS